VLGGDLRDSYESWRRSSVVEEKTAEGMEKFLQFLSDEWKDGEKSASDIVLDLAGKHFNRVRAQRALDEAGEELDRDHPELALARMASVNRVELGTGCLIKPGQEYDPWMQAFDQDRQKPLVVYSQGLGRFFQDSFGRDTLISFMGPDKSGKSFWLSDVAFRALKNRCRVAFFEVGDLLQDEMLLRLGCRTAMRPLRAGKIRVPIELDKEEKKVSKWDVREFPEDLDPREAYRVFKRVCRGRDLFRLSCHPNSSISVDGIRSILLSWQNEGWEADVVLIDYADILSPPVGVRETLDQIDETWKRLRRMSQEFHCLVVTASQSSAAAYSEKGSVLGPKHFSGRKTKLAHVNGMIGINNTEKDKEAGVVRLNWVVRRNSKYKQTRVVTVAGCLALACPAMLSVY